MAMGMVGKLLDKRIPESDILATVQGGQIPFYLKSRKIVCISGLINNHVAHSGGFTLNYLKRTPIDHFILYYNETPHYYIPRTLIPGIIFSPYFQSNYALKHVFYQKTFLWPGKLKSTAYMLLFSKRKNSVVDTGAVYNLKDQIHDLIASGHVTELVCHINGPERGQYVIPAEPVGREHESPPARPADTGNS